MSPSKAEDQLKGGNGNIFNNKEKISSVLKTAVKDKLAELDCLIDDDLPNYIMIMMANRKTKKEMTEALQLFLNDRTTEFTSWLYQMLDNIRKRRESQKKEEPSESNNNKKENEPNKDAEDVDQLEIGIGEEDDLDRELIGDEKSEAKSKSNSKPATQSNEEPKKKRKKKVEKKKLAKKKASSGKPKKKKAKKDDSSDDEKTDKKLKDLVIMVKNNDQAKNVKKKRRKTRDARDKASKLAQMNETESGDSQTEQSDKSKKAKKQRRLERKERSLLKQKKRLSIKLSEQAKKEVAGNSRLMGKAEDAVVQQAQAQQGSGNILYMQIDGKFQARWHARMLAPVMNQMNSGGGSAIANAAAAAGGSLGAPIFGQSAKLPVTGSAMTGGAQSVFRSANSLVTGQTPQSVGGVLGSALSTPRLGVGAGQSVSGLASTSFASLANSNTLVPSSLVPNDQKDQKVKTDTKIINNTAKPADKSSDINSLKKKLAMMERETSRLREMHKLRLKKLETKQRAQEERSKRDAEIQRRQDEEDARTIYVRNLNPKTTEQQLRDHFSVFGAIKRIVLPQDAHAIGSNRGFTFITFAGKEPVEVACSLDGTLLHERSIKVVPKTNMMGKIRPQHIAS
ncbi:Oidioi.mRNA.OKI2018_I69.chr2.g6743.t3.cds [Oikopleura dioica]|uniref:Zinc finger CCCH domain-containing protein 14 n=1 Tax=Oikopleura dioica TaxID=34765 RepID=A0ABN7T8S8_OIKDI|nr:Oidioi.mRNA.OKI2018_I69.chr2.g6743.t3.cds [Oikopleura dioica]